MKVRQICEVCNKTFYVQPSVVKIGKGRFCSRKCWFRWLSINIRGENHYNWRGKIKRVCGFCGKEFQVFPYVIKEGRGKFCSRKCYGKWRSLNIKDERHPNWKGGRIKRECEYCGKEFYVYPHRIKDNSGKYCSRKCFGLSKRGKNSSAWRGGVSKEPYSFDFTEGLKEQIRKRDNYMCQECKHTEEQLGKKLHIHHIDYNKQNNKPENLISLCKSCHSQTNYSRDDWIKYFQDKGIH